MGEGKHHNNMPLFLVLNFCKKEVADLSAGGTT